MLKKAGERMQIKIANLKNLIIYKGLNQKIAFL
jgi:hypothetical protein